MGHLVHAAQQLIDEVTAAVPGGEVEVLDEVDGLGFNRSVRLNNAAVKGLPDGMVEALATDDRVEEVVKSSKGVRVTFVADARADHADPYGITAVAVAQEPAAAE